MLAFANNMLAAHSTGSAFEKKCPCPYSQCRACSISNEQLEMLNSSPPIRANVSPGRTFVMTLL